MQQSNCIFTIKYCHQIFLTFLIINKVGNVSFSPDRYLFLCRQKAYTPLINIYVNHPKDKLYSISHFRFHAGISVVFEDGELRS